jgi:hypothetical protein
MKLDTVEEKELGGPRKLPAQGKWHPGTITTADPGASGKGNPKIAIQVTLTSEDHAGYVLYTQFMTDASTKAAAFSKKHLMGCGIDVSKEQDDAEVAAQLLGKDVFVQVKHEVIKDKDANDNYTVIRYEEVDGKPVPAKKASPTAFSLYDPTGVKAEPKKEEAAPAKEAAPAAAAAKTGGKPPPPWGAKPAAQK